MLKNRKIQIALAVFLVVVLGVVAYFYFSGSNQDQPEDPNKKVIPNDTPIAGGALPEYTTTPVTTTPGGDTALPGQSPVAVTLTPTITPYPGSGPFDWTRNEPPQTLDVELSTEEIEKIQTGDVCIINNIEDSWSNPIEKISCSLARYLDKQILLPLQIMACNFIGTAISTNYSPGVEAKLEGGTCKIYDRQDQ